MAGRRCWAATLGGCSDKISGEHVISASQFDTDVVDVEGFPWCREKRSIGLARLTRKNLCTTHNSALSPVDREAAKLKKGLQYLTAGVDSDARRLSVRCRVRGRLIERWLVKTAINLAMQKPPYPAGLFVGEEPAEEYVRIAFGHAEFRRPQGLWWIAQVEELVGGPTRLGFQPWTRNEDGALVGLFALFHGHRLWLALEGAPEMRDCFLPKLINTHAGGSWIRIAWPSSVEERSGLAQCR